MKLVKRSLSKWIEAAVILVVAILLIVIGVTYGKDGSKEAVAAISNIVGIVMVIAGAIPLLIGIIAVSRIKKNVAVLCGPGVLLIALGISMIVLQYAGEIIYIVLCVVPYLLIALGVIVIADASLAFGKAIKSEVKKSAIITVPGLIYGITALVLGILSITNGESVPVIPQTAQVIVLGVLLAIFAVIIIIVSFVKLPKDIAFTEPNKEE